MTTVVIVGLVAAAGIGATVVERWASGRLHRIRAWRYRSGQ